MNNNDLRGFFTLTEKEIESLVNLWISEIQIKSREDKPNE